MRRPDDRGAQSPRQSEPGVDPKSGRKTLKLWQIQATFDSTSDCESALSYYKADPSRRPFFRGRNPNEVRHDVANDPKFWKPFIDNMARISEDDPRLKGN